MPPDDALVTLADALARVRQLEDLVRAKNALIEAMYDSSSAASWPRGADDLQDEYERAYGVDLDKPAGRS